MATAQRPEDSNLAMLGRSMMIFVGQCMLNNRPAREDKERGSRPVRIGCLLATLQPCYGFVPTMYLLTSVRPWEKAPGANGCTSTQLSRCLMSSQLTHRFVRTCPHCSSLFWRSDVDMHQLQGAATASALSRCSASKLDEWKMWRAIFLCFGPPREMFFLVT